MRQEVRVVVMLRLAERRFRRGVDFAAHHAGLDRLEGGALNLLDLAEQVFELGVRLAEDRHAREVADIAVVVAAGIEREHVAASPSAAPKARGCGSRPAAIRQYSKVSPRLTSSRLSASANSCLVVPGPWRAITASIESITRSEAVRSFSSSSGVLRARSRSSANRASLSSLSGNALRSAVAGIERQECELGADPARALIPALRR